jgi:hypothetical protein
MCNWANAYGTMMMSNWDTEIARLHGTVLSRVEHRMTAPLITAAFAARLPCGL